MRLQPTTQKITEQNKSLTPQNSVTKNSVLYRAPQGTVSKKGHMRHRRTICVPTNSYIWIQHKRMRMRQRKQRFWKVAPGGQGFLWVEQRDNDCIAIGWGTTGDLDNYRTEERIRKRFAEVFRGEKTRPTQLLKFYEEIMRMTRFWPVQGERYMVLGELLVAISLMIAYTTNTVNP